MGFEFADKPKVEVCGKLYECDITNTDLIECVVRDFPAIVRAGQALEADQNELRGAVAKGDNVRIREISDRSMAHNRELLKCCQAFIVGCLGQEEYNEIFRQRRPNSTEHLSLCTYLFGFIMEGRDKIVSDYLDLPPDSKLLSVLPGGAENAADTATE